MNHDDESSARLRQPGVAFLLSQLGAESARRWRHRLGPIGLDPRQAMLLRLAASAEGRPQQSLALELGLPPSRVVAIVDELERDGLLERRASTVDRRANAIHLTAGGAQRLDDLLALSIAHERDLTASLSQDERRALMDLLLKTADGLDLVRGVHQGGGADRPGRWTETTESGAADSQEMASPSRGRPSAKPRPSRSVPS